MRKLLLFVVTVNWCAQHRPSYLASLVVVSEPAPTPPLPNKRHAERSQAATTESMLDSAAASWAARNFTHAATAVAEALGPSKGSDRRVWATLRKYQQYLTRRAENVALRGMFKKLIALNQATLDDLVEFSYIAALGDGNGAGSAEDSGGPTFDDAAKVVSIIKRFRRVPKLVESQSSAYRAKIHFAMGRLLDAQGNHALKLERSRTTTTMPAIDGTTRGIEDGPRSSRSAALFAQAFEEFAAGNQAATVPISATATAGKGGVLPEGKVAQSIGNCLDTLGAAQAKFTPQSLRSLRPPAASPSPPTTKYTHVFIVGFPRSGTSLVDQIVAAHPNAWSRGEHSELQYVASWLAQAAGVGNGDSTATRTTPADADSARAIAKRFTRSRLRWPRLPVEQRDELFQALSTKRTDLLSDAAFQSVLDTIADQWAASWSPPSTSGESNGTVAHEETTHVVSCVSFDINLLWLLPTFFPSARIVFVERCPLDVALSNYITNFVLQDSAWCGLHYAFDFEDLSRVQAAYRSLVDHWSTVLADDDSAASTGSDVQVLRLGYERLVTNPAETIPELLKFLGLPPSESCMHHHEPLLGQEKRWKGVSTASLAQVNEPIHGKRKGRWKNYRDKIEEAVLDLSAFVSGEEDKAACGFGS